MPPAIIPYGAHCIDDADIDAVAACLRSDYLTTGPEIERFEKALAHAVDAPYTVVCGNGTQALHLAVTACGIGPGDYVIVPAMTFAATANAVRYAGGEVVFADVDPITGLISVETALEAEAKAMGPVKAIMPVHLGGLPADLPGLSALAKSKGWRMIEDACHALGTTFTAPDGKTYTIGDGQFSDCCTFSFHPVKTIAMGEGGAVTTRDPALAEHMARLRTHGITRDPAQFQNADMAFDENGAPNPWYMEMVELGFNYRAPDINCALGTSQLAKLPEFVNRRRALSNLYADAFAGMNAHIRPIMAPAHVNPGWHLFRVLIDFKALGQSRAKVMAHLRTLGIGSQVHYIPVNRHPYYEARYGKNPLPGADAHYAQTLSLPLFPNMADHVPGQVVDGLRSICQLI